jgi:LacI family transcriptional regulator
MDPHDTWVAETSHDEGGAMRACDELLRKNPQITAMICLSDILALGVMRAATNLGLSIPDRLSVTGFDDIPQASNPEPFPSLTTVRQDGMLKGQLAAEALIHATSQPIIDMQTMLIVRSSTGSPKH